MSSSRHRERSFIENVSRRRGCELKQRRGSGNWTLRGSDRGIDWACDLVPLAEEVGPALRWRAESVRFDEHAQPLLTFMLRHADPKRKTSYGLSGNAAGDMAIGAVLGLSKLWRRRREPDTPVPAPPTAIESILGDGWSGVDSQGILSERLVQILLGPPLAWVGSGTDQPAYIDSAWLNQEGLIVESTGWWDSEPALDYSIDLGVALAQRIREVRG